MFVYMCMYNYIWMLWMYEYMLIWIYVYIYIDKYEEIENRCKYVKENVIKYLFYN